MDVFTAMGICGGPIIAAMFTSCNEVFDGKYVPALFTLFRTALGVGALLGPVLAGMSTSMEIDRVMVSGVAREQGLIQKRGV